MADCEWCDHAAERGYWPDPDRTHCVECHRTWSGRAESHCTGCHRSFSSPSAFDRHQDGHRCLDPAAVQTEKGRPVFARRGRVGGTVWVLARGEHYKARS